MELLPPITPNVNKRHTILSGIELNQDQMPTDLETHKVDVMAITSQTFHLPQNFKRGDIIPEISGIQVCLNVLDADAFELNFRLEVIRYGDWVLLDEGSISGAHADGDFVWITIYFNEPIKISEDDLTREYKFRIQTDSEAWLSVPPPLPEESTIDNGDGILGQFMFRVLAMTADTGVDFLGNNYRSVVTANTIESLNTQSSTNPNGFWLSKPNPSKFAVESLYFDISDEGHPTVFDKILLDPITPGVFFNVYYTDEGDSGTNETEWEQKLWKPVYQDFKADRRQEHVLRDPITAKYVKIEFTHLQPQFYQPGTFHQASKYKKHPKWVLEYFMSKLDYLRNTDDINVAKNVKVIFDGFDLAYNYYVDDLNPSAEIPSKDEVQKFITTKNDASDQVDQNTLNQIKTLTQTFTTSPADRVRSSDSILSAFVEATKDFSYPVEKILRQKASVSQVSSLNRMDVVVENQMPVMFFYVTCRHTYREVMANYENDRAYFVGVRELALTRDHYTVASDTDLYVESLTDYSNAARNDFLPQD